MLFQSLLSTSMNFSNTLLGGSSAENAVAISALKEASSPSKHVRLGIARTFDDIKHANNHKRPESSSRRTKACSNAGDDQSRPVATRRGDLDEDEDSETLGKLVDWKTEDEIKPLWSSQRNYGTFTRTYLHYSASAMASVDVNRSQPTKSPEPGAKSTDVKVTSHEQPTNRSTSNSDSNFIMHNVSRDDTLSALALKYRVTVNDIMRANGMTGSSQR
mmetsp:Transcript_34509/g.108167  ORF Transcript_34509/g.108167 Transcript_34509/m.108167 type:complete len:217 (+) Transcript_34509:124-774(+)